MAITARLGRTSNQKTDKDEPLHQPLASRRGNIADLLAMAEDIELDIPARKVLGRAADLS